jgi:hypothetical protein
VLLTITTTAEPASDLGFLLHKHPGRVQSFDVSVGAAHVFYPEAGERRTTAALLLEVDPVGLVRGRHGPSGEGFARAPAQSAADLPVLPHLPRRPARRAGRGGADGGDRAQLAAGRLTVVDATNVQLDARRALVALAREHDVLPTAIVLDVADSVCRARNASRPDRDFGDHVIRRQHGDLRRSLRGLQKEGFRTVHVLRGEDEIAAATITRTRLYNDRRHQTGPFDVIGDIHGCAAELQTLLVELGYTIKRDESGRATGASRTGRRAVFVGDLVDRGPDTPGVLRLVMGMVNAGDALCVPGNHENKLVRALRGRKVQITHGLAESLAQLEAEPDQFRAEADGATSGRPTAWTGSSWPRFSCSPPTAPPTRRSRTRGTSTWPTASSPPTRRPLGPPAACTPIRPTRPPWRKRSAGGSG